MKGIPAGSMVEGIPGVRNVITVSRLIPHGASLVQRDDSSQVVPPLLSASISGAVESNTELPGVTLISVSSLVS